MVEYVVPRVAPRASIASRVSTRTDCGSLRSGNSLFAPAVYLAR
jgi:hypothetical protein